MKLFILLLLTSVLCSQKEKINKIQQIVIGKNVMIFKSSEKDELWTIQTITRNFDVYNLSIDKGSASSEEIKGKMVLHYETDTASVVTFFKFRSMQHKETILFNDLHNYGINRNFGVKEKVGMIAFLNREDFPFIEKFFEKTFQVGNNKISTTLKRSVNVIKYVDGKELIYQDDFYIHGMYPTTKFSVSKNNYTWAYKNGTVLVVPTENYIKSKRINAIKSGREWYNNKWKSLRKKGKLEGRFTKKGLNWISNSLTDSDKNLVSWWKKN